MRILFYLAALMIGAGCQQQVPIDDLEQQPVPSAADSAYANIYRSLDGNWKGDFEVFRDDSGEPRNEVIMYNPDPSVFYRQQINSIQLIRVHQRYESVSPFFQKVTIEDQYLDGRVVTSHGVNKVQDGEMWCVVRKPDETVIHRGKTEGPQTIIWQRNEQNPQKIEYFKETVTSDRYTIIGWGYYEGDDTSLMPRYWFYGIYQRD